MSYRTRVKQLSLAVALTACSLTPVFAAEQSGLVNVNIENVAQDIAKNINVNVSQIPVTVQAPIGVAATVCGVAANILAEQKSGDTKCTAKSTNQALNQVVQRQIGDQKAGGKK